MTPQYAIGDSFHVQFVWRLPDDDYIRAFFQVRVLEIHYHEQRYLVQLEQLIGGIQEAPDGTHRPKHELTPSVWANIVSFIDNRVLVAYESANQPLYMRYATLTGEHTYFTRHNKTIPSD